MSQRLLDEAQRRKVTVPIYTVHNKGQSQVLSLDTFPLTEYLSSRCP